MNTTGAAIDVQVFVYHTNGTTIVNGTPVTILSGETVELLMESLFSPPGGSANVNVKITSADTSFSSANVAAWALIVQYLPGGGSSFATVPVLWKNE
jgi:hypothetical protein